MASMSGPNNSGAARRAERMVRSGQTPKPVVKQKLVVDPRPNDSKLLAKLPVTQAHLNTIKKYYGI